MINRHNLEGTTLGRHGITLLLAIFTLLPPLAEAGLGTAVSPAATIDSRPPAVGLDPIGDHLLLNAGQSLDFHWTHFDDNPGMNLVSFRAHVIVDEVPISTVSWFPGPDDFTWSWTAPEIQSPHCRLEVMARDAFGNETRARSETFTVLYSTTDAAPDARMIQVVGPAPNPFNPVCRLDLALGAAARVTVSVFDTRGRRIHRLHDGPAPAGRLPLTWTGTDDKGRPQPGGLYLFLVEVTGEAGTWRELRKAVLLP